MMMVVMIIVELAMACQIEMEIGGQGLGCIFYLYRAIVSPLVVHEAQCDS